MRRIDDIMCDDITCEDLHLASVAGMDDICNTPKQKTLEQSPKASEDADEESHRDLSDKKNAKDFTNHKRTLRNDFVAPREVGMGTKDKQS